jgi:hypothetical protein
MGSILLNSLIALGIVLAVALAVYIAILPTIACFRTRRLNHIYDQLNQIIELLGGTPHGEDDNEDIKEDETDTTADEQPSSTSSKEYTGFPRSQEEYERLYVNKKEQD